MKSALLVLALVACGPTARDKAISDTYVAINAARDGYIAYDSKHENDIVSSAQSKDEAVTKLVDYRLKRTHVLEAFTAAYHALSAALLVNSDPKSLTTLLQAASDLKAAITALEKE